MNTIRPKFIPQDIIAFLAMLGVSSVVLFANWDWHCSTIYPKYIPFFISVLLCVSYLFIAKNVNHSNLYFTYTDFLVVGFIIYTSIHSYISGAESSFKLINLVLLGIMYLCLKIMFSIHRSYIKWICLLIIWGGIIEYIWGMLQLYDFTHTYNKGYKITGSFFNPGPYAGYLVVIAPLALHYVLTLQKRLNSQLHKVLYYSSILFLISIVLLIPATFSRASWIALLVGVFYIVYIDTTIVKNTIAKFKRQSSVKKYLSISLIALVVGLCLFLFVSLKFGSATGRITIWMASLNYILFDKGIWGAGLGHFPEAYGTAQSNFLAQYPLDSIHITNSNFPEYCFNEFIQIAMELGIIGFVLYITTLISSVKSSVKSVNTKGLIGMLLSFLVFSSFSYPFSLLPFSILLFTLLAALSSQTKLKSRIYLNSKFYAPKVLVITCISIVCIYSGYVKVEAIKEWNKISSYPPHIQLKIYKQNYNALSDQYYFLRGYSNLLSSMNKHEDAVLILNKAKRYSCDPILFTQTGVHLQHQGDYNAAEAEYNIALGLVPNRIYPLFLLAKLYEEQSDFEKTTKYAKQVIEKKPKFRNKLSKELKEKALQLLETYRDFEE